MPLLSHAKAFLPPEGPATGWYSIEQSSGYRVVETEKGKEKRRETERDTDRE